VRDNRVWNQSPDVNMYKHSDRISVFCAVLVDVYEWRELHGSNLEISQISFLVFRLCESVLQVEVERVILEFSGSLLHGHV
jgi:hypothetical protein